MKSSWAMKVVMMKRRSLCTAATAKVTATRWERVKNSRAGKWCRSVVSDYKEACRDVVVGAWERPLKALTYLGLLGGASACAYTNPGEDSLRATLLESANQLGLLSPWIRSGASDGHVLSLTKLHNEGRLRHLSLGVASLVWRADYDEGVSLYEASCGNLTVPWRELPQRVLDVGFAGRWWMLEKKMKDYDINEEEFKSLPTHMLATLPPTVQEVERNETLHKASWLPLKMEEEEVAELKESSQDAAVVPEIVEEMEKKESSVQ